MSSSVAKETTTVANTETKPDVSTASQDLSSMKESSSTNESCAICYTVLTVKNTVVTPCNHLYCSSCFFTWLGRKETCALCRQTLIPNTILEERFEELQGVQRDILVNYRYRRALNADIKKIKKKEKKLTDKVFCLQKKQIRMRELLDYTREACRQLVIDSAVLQEAAKNQKNSLELLTSSKQEWDDLCKPLEKEEMERNDTQSQNSEINITEMTHELNRLLQIERRSVRSATRRERNARSQIINNNAINDNNMVNQIQSVFGNPIPVEEETPTMIAESNYEGQITDDDMPPLESIPDNNETEIIETDSDSIPSLESSISENENDEGDTSDTNTDSIHENESENRRRRRVVMPERRRTRFHFRNVETNFVPTTTNDIFVFNGNQDGSTGGTSYVNNIYLSDDEETNNEDLPGAMAMTQLFARPELPPTIRQSSHTFQLQE